MKKEWHLTTTNRTYPLTSATGIPYNGYPRHDGDRKTSISIFILYIVGYEATLLTLTFFKKINGPCFIFLLLFCLNEYVIDFLYGI